MIGPMQSAADLKDSTARTARAVGLEARAIGPPEVLFRSAGPLPLERGERSSLAEEFPGGIGERLPSGEGAVDVPGWPSLEPTLGKEGVGGFLEGGPRRDGGALLVDHATLRTSCRWEGRAWALGWGRATAAGNVGRLGGDSEGEPEPSNCSPWAGERASSCSITTEVLDVFV